MRTKFYLLLSILIIAGSSAQAQKSFRQLSAGLEIGTTGVGLELGTNITKGLYLRAGFNMLPYSYNTDFDVDYDRAGLEQINADYNLGQYGVNINEIGSEVRLKAKTGLYNGKLLVDYHPGNTSFRITAGLYFGKDRLVTVDGSLPEQTWSTLNEVNRLIRQHPEWGAEPIDLSVVVADQVIRPDDQGRVDAGIKINTVKPYVGIGFGRTIPKRGFTCKFDLGVMFHGKPSITSKDSSVSDLLNKELENNDILKYMRKYPVYPMLSFTLTQKLFDFNKKK